MTTPASSHRSEVSAVKPDRDIVDIGGTTPPEFEWDWPLDNLLRLAIADDQEAAV